MNDEDYSEDNFYEYHDLDVGKGRDKSELDNIDPIYELSPISFCWLDSESNGFMYSIWKYIVLTRIATKGVRYLYPMFGEDYDLQHIMSQTMYLN